MNREDIIRMAREAGFEFKDRAEPRLEIFAALVAAHEREECANVCESLEATAQGESPSYRSAAEDCAYLIRARGNA